MRANMFAKKKGSGRNHINLSYIILKVNNDVQASHVIRNEVLKNVTLNCQHRIILDVCVYTEWHKNHSTFEIYPVASYVK